MFLRMEAIGIYGNIQTLMGQVLHFEGQRERGASQGLWGERERASQGKGWDERTQWGDSFENEQEVNSVRNHRERKTDVREGPLGLPRGSS